MLIVAPLTEVPSNIVHSVKVDDVCCPFIFFVDTNFRGPNVVHVPGGVIEDVSWASEPLEDGLSKKPRGLISMQI
jgi:hypothetical protein